jgi:hypothetical protein
MYNFSRSGEKLLADFVLEVIYAKVVRHSSGESKGVYLLVLYWYSFI